MDSFRRLIRAIRDFRSILWFIGIVFGGLLFVKNASATVNVKAIANTPIAFTSTGDYLGKITYEAKFAASSTGAAPAAQTMYYNRNITIPKATVGSLARGWFRRTPAALVSAGIMSAAAIAMGWLIDEIYREINTPGNVQPNPSGSGITQWCIVNGPCAPTIGELGHEWITSPAWGCSACATWVIDGWFLYQGAYHYTMTRRYDSGTIAGSVYVKPYGYTGGAAEPFATRPSSATSGTVATPIPDNDMSSLIANNPALWPEPFKWPNGNVVTVTGMPAQAAEVANQYRTDTGVPKPSGVTDRVLSDETAAAGATTVAAPVPAPVNAPTTTTGTVTEPQASTATAAASASVTFPVFCTWASTVCAALDWLTDDVTEVPADMALPEVEVPIVAQTFESGLGAGSCPGEIAVEFEFNGTRTFGFSYQPMCDFATMINPLILLLGAITSALVVSGIRMKNA